MDPEGPHSKQESPGHRPGGLSFDVLGSLFDLGTIFTLAQQLAGGNRRSAKPSAGRATSRMPAKRLTTSQIDQLVAGYQAGKTVAELCQSHHLHRTTVLHHLEQRAIPRRRNQRALTDTQVEAAARTYALGFSLTDTAAQFGVNAATIKREFRRAGIPTRPRRGWPTSGGTS